MIVAQTLRNRIPDILKTRNLSISDLQRKTGLSYPAAHNIATVALISDQTRVGTLRKVSDALGVGIADLVIEEDN